MVRSHFCDSVPIQKSNIKPGGLYSAVHWGYPPPQIYSSWYTIYCKCAYVYAVLRPSTPIVYIEQNRNPWILIDHRPIPPFLLNFQRPSTNYFHFSASVMTSGYVMPGELGNCRPAHWIQGYPRRKPGSLQLGHGRRCIPEGKPSSGEESPRKFQMVKSKVSGWFSPIVNPFFHKTPGRKRIAVAEGPRHGAAVQSIWSLTCNCGCWFHTCLFSILFGMIT